VRTAIIAFAVFSLVPLAAPARAQDPSIPLDAEGCNGFQLIPRYTGSHINSCDNKQSGQAEMPVSKDNAGNITTKKIEGEYHYWEFVTPKEFDQTQIFSDFDAALQSGGFHVDYDEKPDTIAAHRGGIWLLLNLGRGYYDQTIVVTQGMQPAVLADEVSLSQALAVQEHIALYGVQFEPDKATMLPDSEIALQEILNFLQDNPAETLHVVGYSDNTGHYDDNLKLSQARADAIVAWLVDHGIDATRLTPKAFGQSDTVAEIGTDAGRGKTLGPSL